MANEEQRRAFASYMGTAVGTGGSQGQSQGQPIPQYPGSVANPANPYLLNQFPGLGGGLPTAPTPPPAVPGAPSSVASFPSYAGGFPQGGFGGFGGYAPGAYGQNGLTQRPGPLGQAETANGQQSMPPPSRPPGYVQVSRNYNAQPPPPQGYGPGWQYTDPMAEQNRRYSGAPAGSVVPISRGQSGEIVESRSRHTNDYYHYQQHGNIPVPPGPPRSQAPAQPEEVSMPVMLCHMCSHCGQMRSAGFHRSNPVVPGKPLVSQPCRRCKKKIKSQHRSRSSFTRVRTCTADEPCDWPRESFEVDIEHSEHRSRGRRRSRDAVYVTRYSPSRPRIVRRSSSGVHLGLGVLQQPPHEIKSQTRERVSSLSPGRSTRYGEVWPPPDVVRMKASSTDKVFPAPPPPLSNQASRNDEVWPPPDVVSTHAYRKVERNLPPRPSSRIIELSPSPPPARTRATRVAYGSASRERRYKSRSPSPIRVSVREEYRREDVEARVMAHPMPYRVVSDRRTLLRESDDTSSANGSTTRTHPQSPTRSILKSAGMDRETPHRRRASVRESQQSTHVEVGGPRVHFGAGRQDDRAAPESRGRALYEDERPARSINYERYHEYSRHRQVDDAPPEPPVEEFERIRIRRSTPSPQRISEEIRIDRARRLSPSPPPRRYEEVLRVRHTSPHSPRGRQTRLPLSPPPPERPAYSSCHHISRTRAIERPRSMTPPPPRRQQPEQEDETDSDSAQSAGDVTVRSWRGIDENGQPATFVEERRTVRMIEQGGSEGGSEYRPLRERLATRSWRDV